MTDAVLNMGVVNGHIIGRILKEAARRAMYVIATERSIFEATNKTGYDGLSDDVFTSADTKAQEIYLRTFRECFPNCGVIGEENELQIDPTGDCTAYFTVDPLDGTKAYVRRQSHGVSTMVALVNRGEVISAYIGDVNASEVYGYRPNSNSVYRITQLNSFEKLGYNGGIERGGLFGLLRDPLGEYSPETAKLITDSTKCYEIMGSSIGTWFARLWKREVSMLALPPGHETPWDSTPVIGISKKLGYVFLRYGELGWQEFELDLPTSVVYRDYDMVVIHRRDRHLLY